MRKLYSAILAGLLAASALLFGGGSAHAADGPHTSPTLTCTVGNGYTFTFVIHWRSSGGRVRIVDVKVLDAAHGHNMHYVGAIVEKRAFTAYQTAAGWAMSDGIKYPRLQVPGGYLAATRADPVIVKTFFVGFTKAGTVTPLCETRPAFWT